MNKYSVKKTPRKFTQIEGFAHLISIVEARGDRPLYKCPRGKKWITVTSGEFARMCHCFAAGLDVNGLSGKRIAIIGDPSPEWVATYLATIAGGGVAIPMDKELALSEIEGFLASVDAEAIVYSPTFNEKFTTIKDSHPTLRVFIPFDGESDEQTLPFSKLLAMGESHVKNGYKLPERDHDALATMLFTSGTTGTSKCVMLSEANTCSCVNAACASANISGEDSYLSVLPLHHTYELAIMLCALNYGALIGINDSLRHLMHNLKEFQPTTLILVPLFVSTMYKRIMDEAKKKGKDKLLKAMIPVSNTLRTLGIDMRKKIFASVIDAFGGRLTKIICGGAALGAELVKKFDDFGIQICEGYGITECSPFISLNRYFSNKPGSVGTALPKCKVRIATQGKNDLGYDIGEIQAKGDNVMLGYYKNDEANEEAFTEDGWYRTGDIGYMDEDGYIYITGRMKSVIVLENGKNVFPEEIEEYLANIPEIAESVVVGRKADKFDSVILTAVVYPNKEMFPEDTDLETIYKTIYKKIQEQNTRVASFKKIAALELRDTEFEKTTSKKIKRHLVK